MPNNIDKAVSALLEEVRGLQALSLLHQAECASLLRLIQATSQSSGVSHVQGKSLRDWFYEDRERMLSARLFDAEDIDPQMAADLLSRIRRAQGKPGIDKT